MDQMRLPRNDGWMDVEYRLGGNAMDDARVGGILNEACRVFHHHAKDDWLDSDRETYAQLLEMELRLRPSLAARLLNTDDPVVRMLTLRALELLTGDETGAI